MYGPVGSRLVTSTSTRHPRVSSLSREHRYHHSKWSVASDRALLARIWVSALLRNDETVSEPLMSSPWMSHKMFQAFCHILDFIGFGLKSI